MKTEKLIRIDELCVHYSVEPQFFLQLHETGLIEILIVKETRYIQITEVKELERMVRLYHDLHVNPEGMDVVFNLLQKIEDLHAELHTAKNRLRLYEDE